MKERGLPFGGPFLISALGVVGLRMSMEKYTIRHDKSDQRRTMLGDGKVALGVTLGLIFTIFVWLIFEFKEYPQSINPYVEYAPIAISLLVATVSTFLATSALLEQRRTRESGTDPVLVAHLGQRADARELITFNVSNIGAGAALNVGLKVEKPKDDLVKRSLITNTFRAHHPFTVIPQGKSIEFSLSVGWDLLGDIPLPPFQAKLDYEDLAGGEYESEFTIDVREMQGLGAEKSPQMRIVTALEALAEK